VLAKHDDNVSASKNRPEDRLGWREIIGNEEPYDAVIAWKIDRLARRVVDFLNADQMLQTRGAAIVAVEDPIDMTTPEGRAFATMLAVFAEMEAAAMSARASAARAALLAVGRRAGGRPPFGWMNIKNPDGPGVVLAKDPERIGFVIQAVSMIMAGKTLFSVVRSFESEGVKPRERSKRKQDKNLWWAATIDDLLRNPTLCGMTPYEPGRKPGPRRRTPHAVLRDKDGVPVINESIAIMEPSEWRALTAKLDANLHPGTRPAHCDVVHPLLFNLLRCRSCEKALYKNQFPTRVRTGTLVCLDPAQVPVVREWARNHGFDVCARGRIPQEIIAAYQGNPSPSNVTKKFPYYGCINRNCERRVTVGLAAIEKHVVEEFLEVCGGAAAVAEHSVEPEPRHELDEIEAAIDATAQDMTKDDANYMKLTERMHSLKAVRAALRVEEEDGPARPKVTRRSDGATIAEAWAAEEDVTTRRMMLTAAIDAIWVDPVERRGGRYLDPNRVKIQWRGQLVEDEAR
jgi:DNA invertase Pin-like site-specific DNA recombinase